MEPTTGVAPSFTLGHPRLFWTIGALMTGAGTIAVLVATCKWGSIVSWDSLVYLGFAANSATGKAIAMFCPLFPLVLRVFERLGVSGEHAARYLNGGLFGATVALAIAALRRRSQWVWTPILAGAFVLTSRVLLEQYARVMSDPLALFLGFFGLAALARYLESSRIGWLLLASAGVGLGLATRYACLPFLASGAIAMLTRTDVRMPRRILDAGIFGGLAAVPLASWLIHNLSTTGNAISRKITFHTPGPEAARAAIAELSTWLLPPRVPVLARAGFLLVFVAALAGLVRFARNRHTAPWRSPLARLLLTFIACYVAFMAFVTTTVDARVTVSSRHWLPVYFAGLLLTVILVDGPLASEPSRGKRLATLGVVGFLALSGILMAGKTYMLERDGAEYTRRAMQTSVLHKLLESAFRSRPLYSNDPEAIAYLVGATAKRLPSKFDPHTKKMNPSFEVEMERMGRDLRYRAGLTVRFAGPPTPRYPSVEELEIPRSMQIIAQDETATIYGSGL